MYGKDCHNKHCLHNSKSGCTNPKRTAFMLCEKPSRRQIDNILKRLGVVQEIVLTLTK